MNRFNDIPREEDLKTRKRNELMAILKDHKEKGKELPSDWSKMKNDELVQLILELESDNVDEKTIVENKKVSAQNPFGEEIIETIIPIDQLNPKIKVKQVTVNFKPLLFPVGKKAKMPKSYYEALIYSMEKDMQTQMRLQANRMKEV